MFFNYEKPAKLASLHFNLSNVSESAFNNFGTINATLVDNTLGESSSLPITLGSTVDVNNLPANHVYSVSLPGIADAYSGVVYSKLSQGNLTPNNQTVNLAYAKNTDAKYTSTFTLQGSGGSDVPSGQVVSFGTNVIDGNSDYVYTRNEPLTNNHVYQFLTPETVAITINPPVNYTVDYTPRVISKDSHDVVVTYAKSTPPVYTTVNATYWSAWGNNTSYDVPGGAFNSVVVDMPNIDKSYNVIITAFIVTKNNGEYMLATYDPSSQTPTAFYTDAQIQDFVARTKAQGRKVIVAVGGQYFNLKMSNQTDEQLFVTQIETIIDKYGFDGLDLDLEGVAADPKTINTTLLGEAVKTIISNYRNKGDDFWLTMAPEWVYIIPVGYGCGQWGTHSYYNSFYVDLVKNIGIDNVTYIWTQTYNQGEAQGICDNTGNKISPLQGMDNFVADLAWAATTDAGHIANNQGVNSATQMPLIPANKFVIGMPAAIGAAGGVDKYYLSPLQISNAWTIMKNNGINAGGFMNWAADWDATPHAISSLNYSHEAWETGRAVANVIHK